jgi:spore coat polysaccharide biosynthesis protein SpsF
MDLCGKTVLERVIERVQEAQFVAKVVVAAPHHIPICYPEGVDEFIGDEFNVMKRYYDCAKHYNADYIVRITSDCPLIEPDIIDKCIYTLHSDKYDYVAAIEPNYPDGLDTEVFTMELLEKANKEAEGSETEHLVQYFTRQKNIKLLDEDGYGHLKVSVDVNEDLERVRKIWNGEIKLSYWQEARGLSVLPSSTRY